MRNRKVNKCRSALLKCSDQRLCVVRPFTRSTHLRDIPYEGASRLIRLCGGAGYEHRAQQPDPWVFRPPRFDPFHRYWHIYCICGLSHATTIPDLGYCRCNQRDCWGLPIIGRRTDNLLSSVFLAFYVLPRTFFCPRATLKSDYKVFRPYLVPFLWWFNFPRFSRVLE